MVSPSSYDSGTEAVETRSRITYLGDGRQAGKRARTGPVDFPRLFEAMRYSRRILRRFREERTLAVRQYVGAHYSDGGNPEEVPVNLIAKYVQVVGRALVPKTPRIMLSTRNQVNQPAVSAMQDWVNQRLIEMHFAETLHRWVIDAIFCLGVMKVALGTPEDAAVGGYVSPAGQPFAEAVDFDDFVFDSGARDFRHLSYVGHRYRIPLEVAQKMSYFDPKAKKWLSSSVTVSGQRNNHEGDERISTIYEGYEGGVERDFEEMVDLWEVYLPRLRKVYTFCSDAGGVPAADAPPLRVQDWLGPNCGPYHYLALLPVPGQPMPKAPIQDLLPIHHFVNRSYNKLIEQMLRQKSVLPVRGGALDDAKNLKQAGDGEMFQAENADMLREVSFGGPNPVNAQFTIHLQDVFNKQAGNLDLLSGAAPQSKTATQDKILAEGATAGVADMQESTIVGISSVVGALNWYWWYHPELEMKTTRSAPGLPDIQIERTLKPEGSVEPSGQPSGLTRKGRYEDLMCRVDPYSLVYRTPLQRLQFIQMLIKDWMPIMPILAQQGLQFDAMATMKLISEYADEPDVLKIFTIAEPAPPPPGPGGGAQGPGMPSSTERTYTRRSIGADTAAQRESDMVNAGAQFGAEMGE